MRNCIFRSVSLNSIIAENNLTWKYFSPSQVLRFFQREQYTWELLVWGSKFVQGLSMALDNMVDQENFHTVINIEEGRIESYVYTERTCGPFVPSVFSQKVWL